MTMMLDFVGSSIEARDRFSVLPLRLILLSGDFIPLSMAPTLKELLPTENLSIISLGGATEASIWSCYHRIGEISQIGRVFPMAVPWAINKCLF